MFVHLLKIINPLNFTGVKGHHYVHENIRSIFNTFLQLKQYVSDSNMSCLGLSETWLRIDNRRQSGICGTLFYSVTIALI